MSGTKIGGQKAAAKNLERDPDFYRKIALKSQEAWARNGKTPRGFAYNNEIAKLAGAKGGSISRRRKATV